MAILVDDVAIRLDSILREGDFSFENEDFVRDNGLETAVIMSLFTDKRARDDDVLPDSNSVDKRGWWGDLVAPTVDGYQIGSRLWLLERSKTTEETLVKAKEYVKEAVQWLIDDGVAEKIDIEVERQGSPGSDRLVFKVKVYKKDGTDITYEFESFWEGQFD